MQVVVLASGSQYRAQLLTRLGVEFDTVSPDIDESAHPDETAAILAERLAKSKAEAAIGLLQRQSPESIGPKRFEQRANASRIVIASDQVAHCDSLILGKPGTHAKACSQLANMSGRQVQFLTSLYMQDLGSGANFSALDITTVTVRALDEASIERYVAADKPLDCAGSFKVESLGISLFQSVRTDDPTALIGLPLIKVCEGFRAFGWTMP